ncbi:MAG: hypothetical protein MAG581_00821 [Deltaproteobacteria bacterium]|jgi:hypothetical protein|nr:hypothetical protein [Deltaproteobacteria bacterium]
MKKKRFPAVEIHKTITAIIVLLFISFSVHAETIYELDFTSASGNVKEWFEKINWEFREDIDDMNLRFEDGKLVVEPTKDELGVMMREFDKRNYLQDVTKLHIEWGVDQYPQGADWSGPKDKKRNTREAISFMIFFGDKKLDSGFFLAPDLPYFISFFLGEKEKPDQVYYGNYWQEGGRYLCIPCDGSTAKTIVTEINLEEKFKELFGKEQPPVSALGIEVDVQKTGKSNGRHSKAFIKHIKLMK